MIPSSKLLAHPSLSSRLIDLFAQLPDVLFWIKDTELKTVWINPTVAYYVNLKREQIIGKTDMDIYPLELALNYEKDDKHVIRTGKAIVGKVELLVNRFGAVEWRKVTKQPIIDDDQKVIGTTGVSIPFDNANEALPQEYEVFTRIINYASSNLHERIGVKELAKFAETSESTLNRRFRQTLQITPQQLLSQLRVSKACQLLQESVLNISEIADSCGYDSAAAFSRAFRKTKHTTPSRYRGVKA